MIVMRMRISRNAVCIFFTRVIRNRKHNHGFDPMGQKMRMDHADVFHFDNRKRIDVLFR